MISIYVLSALALGAAFGFCWREIASLAATARIAERKKAAIGGLFD